jgi:hypothetical protein
MATNADPQDDPKNPVIPGSSPDPKDVDPKDPKSGDPKNPSTPTAEELAAIRHDARYRERRATVNQLKSQGFDVTLKTLDSFLKQLDPKKLNLDPKDPVDPDPKKKKSKVDDDDEGETVKLLRREIEDLKGKASSLSDTTKASVVEAAITKATAGIAFANESAAEDAILAFQHAYQFELADDNRSVRVLDRNGDPILKNYKEVTKTSSIRGHT